MTSAAVSHINVEDGNRDIRVGPNRGHRLIGLGMILLAARILNDAYHSTLVHGLPVGSTTYVRPCRWGNYAASVRFELDVSEPASEPASVYPLGHVHGSASVLVPEFLARPMHESSSCDLVTSTCSPSESTANMSVYPYIADKTRPHSLYRINGTGRCITEQERMGWFIAVGLLLVSGTGLFYYTW